jgi:glucan biosynthesis protein
MGVSFCLRLKKNYCLETENLIWERLDQLGVVPGTSLYFCMSEGPKNQTSSRV